MTILSPFDARKLISIKNLTHVAKCLKLIVYRNNVMNIITIIVRKIKCQDPIIKRCKIYLSHRSSKETTNKNDTGDKI